MILFDSQYKKSYIIQANMQHEVRSVRWILIFVATKSIEVLIFSKLTKNHQHCNCSRSQNKVHRESKLMNILLEPALSGQVPSFQSKNWIGNLLKMNYFEFSFRENEISAGKLCMATAGLQLIRRAGLQDSAILLNFLKLNWNWSQGVDNEDIVAQSVGAGAGRVKNFIRITSPSSLKERSVQQNNEKSYSAEASVG